MRRGEWEKGRVGDLFAHSSSPSPRLPFSHSFSLRVLCALCGYFFLLPVRLDAAPQEVVLVEGAPFLAELVSIDAGGLASFRVATKEKADEVRTLALEDIVRWGHPAKLRAQTVVVLADGGRIVTAAEWAGGAVVRLEGDDVVVLSHLWDEERLPRTLVSGIVFAQQSRADVREKLIESVRGEPSPGPSLQRSGKSDVDTVWLTNGDRLTGKITELDRGSLTIKTLGRDAKVPLSRVQAVEFGSHCEESVSRGQKVGTDEPSPSPSLKGRGKVAVALRDGSFVFARTIRADDRGVEIDLGDAMKLTGGAADDVVAIQSLDGRIVYLSDLDKTDYRSVPYLSISWPLARDRNVLDEPIVVRGERYLKGIGMHSAARLTYPFDRDFQRFESTIAVDDSAKGGGSVVFGVHVLRDGKWAEAFTSEIVRGGEQPPLGRELGAERQPVSVDLRGAKGITLTVDFADRGDELDHAVWLDARLVR